MKAEDGINSSILDKRLKNLQDLLMERMDEVSTVVGDNPIELEVDVNDNQINILQRDITFFYRGMFWCAPELFAFLAEVTNLKGVGCR